MSDMMTADEWDAFMRTLPSVTTTTNYGYRFYFVGDDQRLPFTTIADSHNEYERVSKLDRPGVFRLNIGVRRETFASLFPRGVVDGTDRVAGSGIDYAALDVFMPHPDYAKQSFVCILNPAGANVAKARALIVEAHALASSRVRG